MPPSLLSSLATSTGESDKLISIPSRYESGSAGSNAPTNARPSWLLYAPGGIDATPTSIVFEAVGGDVGACMEDLLSAGEARLRLRRKTKFLDNAALPAAMLGLMRTPSCSQLLDVQFSCVCRTTARD